MAETHIITALVRKRSELAGQIETTHEALRKMVLDLENLDATGISRSAIFELPINAWVAEVRPE